MIELTTREMMEIMIRCVRDTARELSPSLPSKKARRATPRAQPRKASRRPNSHAKKRIKK